MTSKKGSAKTRQIQNPAPAVAPEIPDKPQGMLFWLMALSIILPAVFSRATLDPALSIRYLVLCSFVVAFGAFFFLIKREKPAIPFPRLVKALGIVGGLLLAWNIVTAALAINTRETFFEVSRIWTNLAFLLIVLVAVYQAQGKILGLFKVLTLAALAHSVVGICQYYQIKFTDIPGNYAPYGLNTNRNLYGSAQALLLPFCLYVLFAAGRPWKYLSGLTIVALLTSIVLAQTRAAWLATLAIVVVSLLLVVVFVPACRKTWLVGTGAGILATVAVCVVLFSTDSNIGALLTERAGSLTGTVTGESDGSHASGTANERLVIWKKTGQLIADHGVTGVGPANWKIGIQAYGNHGLINQYGHFILDHAHNIYLQVAGETGIPGLMLFLSFWGLVLWIAYQTIRKAPKQEDRILIVLMLAGVIAFAVDGFFSFPIERIEHTYYLFLFAGIILGCYSLLRSEEAVVSAVPFSWKAAFLAVSGFALFLSYARFVFDQHFYRIKAFNKAGKYKEALAEVEAGKSAYASLEPTGDPMEMYSAIAYKSFKQYDRAHLELNRAMELHPYSARVLNTVGTVYAEQQDFEKSIVYYKKALAITPKYDISIKNLAINYYYTGEYDKCLALLAEPSIKIDSTMQSLKQSAEYMLRTKGSR